MKLTNYLVSLQSESWLYKSCFLALCLLLTLSSANILIRFFDMVAFAAASGIPSLSSHQAPDSLHAASFTHWENLFGYSATLNSSSSYFLKGIEYEGSFSMAIIAGPDGQEDVYKAGDKIANGVTVLSISTDSVIISNNGHIETLQINWQDSLKKNDAAIPSDKTVKSFDHLPIMRENSILKRFSL